MDGFPAFLILPDADPNQRVFIKLPAVPSRGDILTLSDAEKGMTHYEVERIGWKIGYDFSIQMNDDEDVLTMNRAKAHFKWCYIHLGHAAHTGLET